MNYNQLDKKTIILSLKKDDYINQSIQELFINEKMNSGWISGIGAIYNIEIAYYDLILKKYIKKSFPKEHELTSLTGNITFIDNKYFVHTHITMSDTNYNSLGGHLFDAQISATGEFKIDLIDKRIDRKYSNRIGLNLWCLDNENN